MAAAAGGRGSGTLTREARGRREAMAGSAYVTRTPRKKQTISTTDKCTLVGSSDPRTSANGCRRGGAGRQATRGGSPASAWAARAARMPARQAVQLSRAGQGKAGLGWAGRGGRKWAHHDADAQALEEGGQAPDGAHQAHDLQPRIGGRDLEKDGQHQDLQQHRNTWGRFLGVAEQGQPVRPDPDAQSASVLAARRRRRQVSPACRPRQAKGCPAPLLSASYQHVLTWNRLIGMTAAICSLTSCT